MVTMRIGGTVYSFSDSLWMAVAPLAHQAQKPVPQPLGWPLQTVIHAYSHEPHFVNCQPSPVAREQPEMPVQLP